MIQMFSFLWGIARPYRFWCAAIAAILALASFSFLGIGKTLQWMLDDRAGTEGTLFFHAFTMLCGFTIAIAGASFGRLYAVSWVVERLITDLRNKLFNHMIHQDLSYFERQGPSEIVSRLTGDMTLLQMILMTSLPIGLRNVMIMIGSMISLGYISMSLSLILGGIIAIIGLLIIFFGRAMREKSHAMQQAIGQMRR